MEEILQNCPLFKGLNFLQISQVIERFHNKTRKFEIGDLVILQNDVCENLMIMLKGRVQAQMIDHSGKLIVVEELICGNVLAPAFIFAEMNRMPVTLVVLEQTEVLYFRKQVFTEMMQKNEAILLNFLQIISNRSRFLSQKLQFHALKSIKNKIAHYLLEQVSIQKSLTLRMSKTQQDLADRFGVTRPSLARTWAEMEKEGLFEVRNKDLKIKNLDALKQIS